MFSIPCQLKPNFKATTGPYFSEKALYPKYGFPLEAFICETICSRFPRIGNLCGPEILTALILMIERIEHEVL